MIFTGQIIVGRFVPDFERSFSEWMKRHNKQQVILSIERQYAKRSVNQNRWLWGVAYKILSEYTGYDELELHEYCKMKFLPQVINLNGKEEIIGGSSRKLTTKEFNEFKEKVQRLGSELGCILPDPNEIDINTLEER